MKEKKFKDVRMQNELFTLRRSDGMPLMAKFPAAGGVLPVAQDVEHVQGDIYRRTSPSYTPLDGDTVVFVIKSATVQNYTYD